MWDWHTCINLYVKDHTVSTNESASEYAQDSPKRFRHEKVAIPGHHRDIQPSVGRPNLDLLPHLGPSEQLPSRKVHAELCEVVAVLRELVT